MVSTTAASVTVGLLPVPLGRPPTAAECEGDFLNSARQGGWGFVLVCVRGVLCDA